MNTHEFLFAQNWVEQFREVVYERVSEGEPLMNSSRCSEAHGESLFRLIDAHYVDLFIWEEGRYPRQSWSIRQRTCCDENIRKEWAGYSHSAVLDYSPLTR